MSRRRSPGHLPTPNELLRVPQIAPLGVLRYAIDVLIVALTAAEPELWPTSDGRDPPCTPESEAADDVIRAAQALARAVDAYCATITQPPTVQ
jgi:hypothetical protein